MAWHYRVQKQEVAGRHTEQEVIDAIRAGLSADATVRYSGTEAWQPLTSFGPFADAVAERQSRVVSKPLARSGAELGPSATPAAWYFSLLDRTLGPFTLERLRDFAETGRIAAQDLVCRDGDADWGPAAERRELADCFPGVPGTLAAPDSADGVRWDDGGDSEVFLKTSAAFSPPTPSALSTSNESANKVALSHSHPGVRASAAHLRDAEPPPEVPGPTATRWFIARGDEVFGPFELSKLRNAVERGELRAQHQLCRLGTKQWIPANSIPELDALFPPPPPPVMAAPAAVFAPPAPGTPATVVPPSTIEPSPSVKGVTPQPRTPVAAVPVVTPGWANLDALFPVPQPVAALAVLGGSTRQGDVPLNTVEPPADGPRTEPPAAADDSANNTRVVGAVGLHPGRLTATPRPHIGAAAGISQVEAPFVNGDDVHAPVARLGSMPEGGTLATPPTGEPVGLRADVPNATPSTSVPVAPGNRESYRSVRLVVLLAAILAPLMAVLLADRSKAGPGAEAADDDSTLTTADGADVDGGAAQSAADAARLEAEAMPFRRLRWGMSETEARAALGFGPALNNEASVWPPEPWTCTQWPLAFESSLDDGTHGRCGARTPFAAMNPDEQRSFLIQSITGGASRDGVRSMDVPFALAADPISVVTVAGDRVPGTEAEASSSAGRCSNKRVRREEACLLTEEIALLFWRARLFGISFLPSGSSGTAPPDDHRVLSAALDGRFSAGIDTDTQHGSCVLRAPPRGGYLARCRVWQNSRTHVELHRFTVGSSDRVRVSYADRNVLGEIDAVETGARASAVAAAEAARANSAATTAGRL